MGSPVTVVKALARNTEQAERFVRNLLASQDGQHFEPKKSPRIEGKKVVRLRGIASDKSDDAMQYSFGL